MAKRRSAYENEYTKQMEEAVFDQKGYDTKKDEAKKLVRAEKQRHKGLVRVFLFLCLLIFTMGAGWLINLDSDNAGPISIFLCVCALIYGFVKWINK